MTARIRPATRQRAPASAAADLLSAYAAHERRRLTEQAVAWLNAHVEGSDLATLVDLAHEHNITGVKAVSHHADGTVTLDAVIDGGHEINIQVHDGVVQTIAHRRYTTPF